MKIVATIEARMTSTRLPGKVLKPILGQPMLSLLIERLKRSKVDAIVVATTDKPSDDAVEALAHQLGVGCFRGSEDDVLDRVLRAAQSVNADLIVEITGDCPLVDPGVVNRIIDSFLATGVDYACNTLNGTYPRGLDVKVFPTAVLAEVESLTQDPADREHVSLYIYEHPERYRLHSVESGLPEHCADWRLTVDTPDDFALIEAIYQRLYPNKPDFTLDDVVALLQAHPELAALNQHIQQKAVR